MPYNLKPFTLLLIISFTLLKPTHAQVANSNIHYLTDTTVNFNALIGQFKNKVIYVDAWATWVCSLQARASAEKRGAGICQFRR
ncbi:hypothetical protein HK413_09435 [Mucilaginibacter sp. S1162]|uniref:Thioredoxin domain-containing protein n=1 Tax=Mucilaginibacter humi TaxID=2732510 RepID=A0ABX1W2F5_9SPHI|nr:hypothetical protein [Mucilaginibacter humi]NNU34315.1 hypothetical protein [Mucilaginibacter humi]